MGKLLDYEITSLKNEVLNLKSWSKKIADQLRTKEYVVPIEFTIGYNINHELASTQMAIIKIVPESQDIQGILFGYGIDIEDLEKRVIWTIGGYSETSGKYEQQFYLQHTENPSDSVGKKLTYNVVITTTALVEITVEYEDW